MRVMRSEHDGQGRTKRLAPQTSPHVFLACILPGNGDRKRDRVRLTLYTSEVFDSISYKHQDDLLVLFSGTSKSNFDRHWRDFDRSLFFVLVELCSCFSMCVNWLYDGLDSYSFYVTRCVYSLII